MIASLFIARRIIFPRSVTAAGKSFYMAVLCVAISLVPLISVLSVSNGLIYGMTSRIIGLSSSHIKVVFRSGSLSTDSAESLYSEASKIAAVDGVVSSYPETDAAALAVGAARREGVMVRAVDFNMFASNSAFSTLLKVNAGSIEDFAREDNGIVPAMVGKKTCELLSLNVGDTFRLVTATRKGERIVPKAFSARVAAIVTSGYEELDATWVFIPLPDAYRKIGNSLICSVMVEVADAYSPALYETQRSIASVEGNRATVFRWDELNKSEYENFASTQAMLICIMTLIVLVASLNISSSLVMLSDERQREIIILKCTGARAVTIEAAYLAAGGAAGLMGCLLGVPLGLLCAVNMNAIVKAMEIAVNAVLSRGTPIHLMDSAYYLTSIPLRVPLKSVVLIVFVTLLLSVAVSALPARRAGRCVL